jgi:hypothetical protein
LLYALDDSVWVLKITALEESADFATLDTEKLFSKLKSHELSRKGRPDHDASLTSKAFVTSTRVGGHVTNLTNTTDSSALEFALSFLCAASDEQYESIPDDEIALLARKFQALHWFHKERRWSPRGCFECGKKKYCFRDKKKKKKFQKMMSRACATLSDLNFFSDDSSSSEEDERPKCKMGNFTSLCLMGKSLCHISDSDVSDDSSLKSLSLRVIELKNALCNQDKLLCKIFCENKKLNLELESSFSEIASLRPAHDEMSAKPCDRCTMIMVNYADLWLIHSHVASLLDGARLELRELKSHYTLLGACTSLLRLRILSTDLIILLATLFYPLCAKLVPLSRVSFSMLSKRTLSFSRRLPI